MKFLKKNKKGFTLVELIVVIAILGILAVIIIPRIGEHTNQARVAHDRATLRTVQGAVAMYNAQHGRWPNTTSTDLGLAYGELSIPLAPFLDLPGGNMPAARSVATPPHTRNFRYNENTGAVTIEPPLPAITN